MWEKFQRNLGNLEATAARIISMMQFIKNNLPEFFAQNISDGSIHSSDTLVNPISTC